MDYNPELMLDYLMGRLDKCVKQQARDTIFANVEQDNRKRSNTVRYARIPCRNACKFCVMLASRGFVYHSEKSAGDRTNVFHPDCNCQIAVAFSVETQGSRGTKYAYAKKTKSWDEDTDASLAYYSPEKLYDVYRDFADSFTPHSSSARRSYVGTRPEKAFSAIGDMKNYIFEAQTLDDLRNRCGEVEAWFNYDKSYSKSKTARNKNWSSLQSATQQRIRDLDNAA